MYAQEGEFLKVYDVYACEYVEDCKPALTQVVPANKKAFLSIVTKQVYLWDVVMFL